MAVVPNKLQMKAGTTRGRASGVMYRLTPAADQAQGMAHVRFAGSVQFFTSRLTEFRELGRPFGVGPFRAEGRGANRVLAKPINHPLSAERLKNFAKGSERHFQVSVCLGPEPRRTGGQTIGNFIQGRQ